MKWLIHEFTPIGTQIYTNRLLKLDLMKYHFVHKRGNIPPLSWEEVIDSASSSWKKTIRVAYSPNVDICQKGILELYCLEKQYQKSEVITLKRIEKDKDYLKKIVRTFRKKARILLKFTERIYQADLSKKSNRDLIALKRKYRKLYLDACPYGEAVPFALKDILQQKLDDYFNKNRDKFKVVEYNLLLQSPFPSFLIKEEMDLLKIVLKVQKKKRLLKDTEIKKLIKEHHKNYQWIHFDYASVARDEDYFLSRIKKLLRKKVETYKKLKELKNYLKIPKRQKQIFKKFKIDSKTKALLKAASLGAFLMDYKKEVFSKAHLQVHKIFQECAKRLNLTLEEIRWLLWREVENALLKKKEVDRRLIKERFKFCLAISKDGKTAIYLGKKARKIAEEIKKDQEIKGKIREFAGTCGSSGFAQGKVRILKVSQEIYKMKKGEILVTSATTPDFVPALKKARAIVTCEGGLTSHAAIVSRELGIPCVIGTKIATEVLKDGDIVEINANHGVVTVLKRVS